MSLPDDPHLTPKELSRRLGVTTGTLKNWRCAGAGPRYIKVGDRVRYPLAYVTAYEERNTKGSAGI